MIRSLLNFEIFGREATLYSYGLFMLLAVILALSFLYFELGRRKISRERIFDNILYLFLVGLSAGRLAYVLFHLNFYLTNWGEIYRYWYGGFYFEGALVFGLGYLIFWLYLKKKKEFFLWLDAILMALLLGLILEKIGYLFSRENYNFSPELTVLFFYGFLLLIFQLVYQHFKEKLPPGYLFWGGLLMISLIRFWETFYSTDSSLFSWGSLIFRPAHLLNFLILTLALGGLIMKFRGDFNLKNINRPS